jgi:hypothetical protein
VETHVNEVLLGGILVSKVDLTAFIEQDDLVENLDRSADGFTHAKRVAHIIDSLRRLVNGDDGS